MYSTYNEGKSVVVERLIKTLKNKIYKHMSANSENVYFKVLDGIVNEVIILLNIMNNVMKKILNLKLVIMTEFQSTKISLLKDMLLIGVKTFLL